MTIIKPEKSCLVRAAIRRAEPGRRVSMALLAFLSLHGCGWFGNISV